MRRDAIDFGSDNIPKLFGKMLMPTLLGMLCMSVMTVIDGVFIGHGVGSDALAAVNIFSPFWLLMTAIGMMLGIGCSVVSSIHLSQDNVKAARINMTQTLIFGVTLALIITILVGLSAPNPPACSDLRTDCFRMFLIINDGCRWPFAPCSSSQSDSLSSVSTDPRPMRCSPRPFRPYSTSYSTMCSFSSWTKVWRASHSPRS